MNEYVNERMNEMNEWMKWTNAFCIITESMNMWMNEWIKEKCSLNY